MYTQERPLHLIWDFWKVNYDLNNQLDSNQPHTSPYTPRDSENFINRKLLSESIENEMEQNENDNQISFQEAVIDLKKIESKFVNTSEPEENQLKREKDEINFLKNEINRDISSEENKKKITEAIFDLDALLNTGINIINETKMENENSSSQKNDLSNIQEGKEEGEMIENIGSKSKSSILKSKTPIKNKSFMNKNVSFDLKTTDFSLSSENKQKLRSPPLEKENPSASPKLQKMNISSGKKAFIDTCKNHFRTSIKSSALPNSKHIQVKNTLHQILKKNDYSNLDQENLKKINIEQEEQVYSAQLKKKVDLTPFKDLFKLKIIPKKDIINEDMSLSEKIDYLRTKKNETLKQIILDKFKINLYFW